MGVVRVHDPVNKAKAHPLGHQPGLRGHNLLQQIKRIFRRGVVARHDMLSQGLQPVPIALAGKVLKRTHADMRRRHPRENGAGERRFAQHGLARGHSSQRPCGGHAQRVHGLRDDIFAQHWPEPGAPVAHAAIGGLPGALELDVHALACRAHDFAQKQGAPIAQPWHPIAKLVASIDLRQRGGLLGGAVSGQHGQPFRRLQFVRIEAQFRREAVVQQKKLCRRHGHRGLARVEPVGQGGVAVVKGNGQRHGQAPAGSGGALGFRCPARLLLK